MKDSNQGRRNWECQGCTCTPCFLGDWTKIHLKFCFFAWLLSGVHPLILVACYDPANEISNKTIRFAAHLFDTLEYTYTYIFQSSIFKPTPKFCLKVSMSFWTNLLNVLKNLWMKYYLFYRFEITINIICSTHNSLNL